MAQQINFLLSILLAGLFLQAFCVPRRFFLRVGNRADNQAHGLPQYEQLNVEDDNNKDAEYGTNENTNDHVAIQTMPDIERLSYLYYQYKKLQIQEAKNDLLRYSHDIATNNPGNFMKIKRGAKTYTPDGRIRLVKVQL